MKTQKDFEEMIKKFLSGEITESEKKILLENSKSNPEIDKL